MNKILTSVVMLLCSINIFAQHRGVQEAISIASDFFNARPAAHKTVLKVMPQQLTSATIAQRRAQQARQDEGQHGYYIVNDEANQRFVVVSADERMYQILGYSDNGTFSAEDAPIQLLDVLGWYDAQMEVAKQYDLANASPKRASQQPIAPMLKTKWGQDSPYNAQCPNDSRGAKSATGCVATAMAQIMNYHQYPAKAQGGVLSYTTKTTETAQSLNFDAISFDWTKMLNTYSQTSSQASKNEVAKLMHACGVSVYMNYNTSSGANEGNIAYAMINYFGYNPNTQHLVKSYYDGEEWNGMIRSELAAGRPILYSGNGTIRKTILGEVEENSTSHQFILDGMDKNGLYHFNFGWSGECDGYFAIDAISPTQELKTLGITLSSTVYDLNEEQGMVIGIAREMMGVEEDIFYTSTLVLETSVPVGTPTNITYLPYCFANKTNKGHTFAGRLGLGVFDKDWNLVETLCNNDDEAKPLYAGTHLKRKLVSSFTYDASTFQDGKQYYIALYAQHTESSRPTIVRTPQGKKDWYLATVTDGKVVLEAKETITAEEPQTGVKGDVNGDGKVDASDIDSIISVIAAIEGGAGADTLPMASSADVNGDGKVDVADIAAVISIMKANN
jgi:hypothetical protein